MLGRGADLVIMPAFVFIPTVRLDFKEVQDVAGRQKEMGEKKAERRNKAEARA